MGCVERKNSLQASLQAKGRLYSFIEKQMAMHIQSNLNGGICAFQVLELREIVYMLSITNSVYPRNYKYENAKTSFKWHVPPTLINAVMPFAHLCVYAPLFFATRCLFACLP